MPKPSFNPAAAPEWFPPKGAPVRTAMFEGLVDPAFTPLDDVDVPGLLDAQASTLQWLDDLGAPADEIPTEQARQLARDAFTAVTDANTDPQAAKAAILAARAPAAVRHLAGMLTEYDWQFVEQAAEIRGFIVAKLLEHSKSMDARISLAALKQLGSVTEVGAFTERIEVTKRVETTTALADRLRERLERLRRGAVDVPSRPVPPAETVSEAP